MCNSSGKPIVKFLHRAGSQTVNAVLSCGHRPTLTKDELAQLQWFIGRAVDCPVCAKGEN